MYNKECCCLEECYGRFRAHVNTAVPTEERVNTAVPTEACPSLLYTTDICTHSRQQRPRLLT
jgi:hypothetical protein